MYRPLNAAPASSLAEERRGAVVGKFCSSCKNIYPALQARHAGKPAFGKDHVSAPCAFEGRRFEPEAAWWEPAVVVLDPAPAPETQPAA